MLDLETIKKNYPENLQPFERFVLREYLQYKILQAIFDSEYGKKLCFLGGTALRIVYGNKRFSEDLDFDNFGLNEQDFDNMIQEIKRKMELEGYEIEVKNVFKGAYRCYLRFPKLLKKMGLSGYEEEKILVQIDTVKQSYNYRFEKFLLNKFDVFTEINVTPADILLSKKIGAAIGRKTLKGRDFFDIVFLFSFTKPNYQYLQEKVGVGDLPALKAKMIEVLDGVDMDKLAKDTQPFLFDSKEIKRVTLFKDFLLSLRD